MLASAKVLNLTLSGVVDFRVQWEQRESYHYSADRWIRRRRRRQLMLQEEKPLVLVSPTGLDSQDALIRPGSPF